MTMYHARAHELQRAMRQRRGDLNISQREVAERGGLSRIAVIRYEKGEISEDIRPSTLREIDKGLDWPEGHAAEILGVPETQQDPAPIPASDALDLRALAKYVEAVSAMQETMRAEIDQIPEDVRAALDEVTNAQTNVLLDLTHMLIVRQS